MSNDVCKFNVYLTDRKWTYMGEFWSATPWGLPVGGLRTYPSGALYDKAVRIKRMA